MKKELLRINHLNYIYTRTRKLENVSFCILEGEMHGVSRAYLFWKGFVDRTFVW